MGDRPTDIFEAGSRRRKDDRTVVRETEMVDPASGLIGARADPPHLPAPHRPNADIAPPLVGNGATAIDVDNGSLRVTEALMARLDSVNPRPSSRGTPGERDAAGERPLAATR